MPCVTAGFFLSKGREKKEEWGEGGEGEKEGEEGKGRKEEKQQSTEADSGHLGFSSTGFKRIAFNTFRERIKNISKRLETIKYSGNLKMRKL